MVTKAIERAQNTVEGRNAESRKDVLKYDEVMNEQRKVIYARRLQILDGRGPPRADARAASTRRPRRSSMRACPSEYAEEWDLHRLVARGARSTGRRRSTRRAARRSARRSTSSPRLVRTDGVEYYERHCAELPGGEETARVDRARRHAPDPRPALARAPLARWTTCARASTCARSRTRTRSSPGSARATRCSSSCSTRSTTTTCATSPTSRPRRREPIDARPTCRGRPTRPRTSPTPPSPLAVAPAEAEAARRRRPPTDDRAQVRQREGRAQRAVLVRLGQEVQVLPWQGLNGRARTHPPTPSPTCATRLSEAEQYLRIDERRERRAVLEASGGEPGPLGRPGPRPRGHDRARPARQRPRRVRRPRRARSATPRCSPSSSTESRRGRRARRAARRSSSSASIGVARRRASRALELQSLFSGRARRARRDRRDPRGRGRHRRAGLDRDAAAHVHALGGASRLRRRDRRGDRGPGGRASCRRRSS